MKKEQVTFSFDAMTHSRSSVAARRRWETKQLKELHSIYTFNCGPGAGWLALSMTECIKAFEGYQLTDEEKTSGMLLMAGYCGLLEDSGLLADGHPSENAAVKAIADRLTKEGGAK